MFVESFDWMTHYFGYFLFMTAEKSFSGDMYFRRMFSLLNYFLIIKKCLFHLKVSLVFLISFLRKMIDNLKQFVEKWPTQKLKMTKKIKKSVRGNYLHKIVTIKSLSQQEAMWLHLT